MSKDISLEDLIVLIREHQGIGERKQITYSTQLENDLGITGDDGCELLDEIQRRFNVSFAGDDGTLREAFQLEKGEFLFHSESGCLFRIIAGLFGRDSEKVKPLTVGRLYQVTLSKRNENPASPFDPGDL